MKDKLITELEKMVDLLMSENHTFLQIEEQDTKIQKIKEKLLVSTEIELPTTQSQPMVETCEIDLIHEKPVTVKASFLVRHLSEIEAWRKIGDLVVKKMAEINGGRMTLNV